MNPANRGLPRTCRILRPSDFARVYAARRSAAAGPLVVYALPTAVGGPRLGLSVSRRIGNAVVRNRWKRHLREAFRLVREACPGDQDLVVVVRSGLPPEGAAALARTGRTLVALAARAAHGRR